MKRTDLDWRAIFRGLLIAITSTWIFTSVMKLFGGVVFEALMKKGNVLLQEDLFRIYGSRHRGQGYTSDK